MLKTFFPSPAGQRTTALLLGLFCALLSAEAALRLGGFFFRAVQEKRNRILINREGFRIMCLGESTTAGGAGAWPALLEGILAGRYPKARFIVINKGMVGFNTADIMRELEKNLDEVRPDLVITMMGMNDDFIRYYEGIPDAESPLFRHFRLYKLFRILLNNEKASGPRRLLPDPARNARAGGPADPYTPFQDRTSYIDQYEASLRRKLERDPEDVTSLYVLGRYWAIHIGFQNRDRELMEKGRKLLLRAARLSPKNSFVFWALGMHSVLTGDIKNGLPLLQKAAELNPRGNNWYYLGRAYNDYGMPDEAEKALLEVLAPGSRSQMKQDAVLELCWLYISRGEFPEAEKLLQKARAAAPYNDKLLGALACLYAEKGRADLARKYAAEVTVSRGNFTAKTRAGFRKLRQVLRSRGIRLAVMQYPMCDPAPLRELFEDREDIIFISNERTFREAVKKNGYKYYFQDMFAGNFGHCTAAGNALIALDAADALSAYLGGVAVK